MNAYFVACRECGRRIDLHERKDRESFTSREVRDHYAAAHPDVFATFTFGMPYHSIQFEDRAPGELMEAWGK